MSVNINRYKSLKEEIEARVNQSGRADLRHAWMKVRAAVRTVVDASNPVGKTYAAQDDVALAMRLNAKQVCWDVVAITWGREAQREQVARAAVAANMDQFHAIIQAAAEFDALVAGRKKVGSRTGSAVAVA